ncbi:LysR family transcriptional regulator [Roseibium marinum]|uniref:DNA-binding transcriptional LysR family regulator n=1 Tax=Roseibium marinum TaxID=281252 RepID=A0A2S3V1X5_9HYPH|nr:LysR family transcriptional regulator [Roseibium marinum]POF33948.1 DNA-binding transcriptional LysR family regulator [Roseibium marinum]
MGIPSPPIELRHLHYFVYAHEYGSFRKAAAALEVQESTISRTVRDLEDRLGVSLFQRHNNGVCLTLAGQRFLERARSALHQIGEGIRDLTAIGCCADGRIKVGIFSSLASGFLPDLLRAFCKDHDGVHIAFIDGNPTEHIAAVRQIQIDVAFITGTRECSNCETDLLWSERVFAVLPQGHPLVEKDELSWHNLKSQRFIVPRTGPGPDIHDFLMSRLANLDHQPEIDTQQVSRDNLLSLVAVGRGLTLTSEATTVASYPGVVYRPIAGETISFSAIWSPRNDNPALRRLLSMARAMSNAAVCRG